MSIFKQPQLQDGIQPSKRSPGYLRFKTKIENSILFNLIHKKKHFFCKNCIFMKKIDTNLYGIQYFRSSSITGHINLTNYEVKLKILYFLI